MLLHIPGVLEPAVAHQYLLDLLATEWEDGARTAGFQSTLVKHNRQLPPGNTVGQRIATHIEQQLLRHPLFISAALPTRIFPMLFNRYGVGEAFGMHVDNAIRYPAGETRGLRTDLSATLFLRPPEDYEGGELVIQDTYGEHRVKLPAGDMVLYPSTSLHRVTPVTQGERIAAFFWIQSLIRDDGQRTLLYELDGAIQDTANALGTGSPQAVALTGVYHNLLRRWAEP
ncbi:Fe2+-dependent dioxygenase [Bordetella holmesii]|uniref:Oxidoreductase, 2OG-Fe(II) oxygenase family protein n=2 Tax=Bordetella holmesii TaxID=35814 RepID=A0A158M971_9BORD|nr:Fe2+-dependent dioxygenase [Bordetella holmesii]AHV93152.1 2OG-Fe(II) oxygenase superfamily protein [Bordetella holmesii ATCC 51541]AIT27050.1 2OG-Fe(II) oxygenase superfamily protein [Bordetella holmesii 44057]EWM43284.1 2OG-Fe(II) oxygenase superfamily protein [Bordetella holmesii 41130]EWM47633.1 2OG-Fe(II) oxygenase superfamily protein [Bordetella holmesii 35009]EWM51799.1 2OG-Fe(II) oxygenase superfamily protein [Bordetella holmesii 70147]